MNPQLLTSIALSRMDENVREAERRRLARGVRDGYGRGRRTRGLRPARRRRYFRRGDARNVEPVHRPAT